MFLGRSSTKIAQIFVLCCTKWPPELKLENTSNNISVTTGWVSTKLDRIVLCEVLYQTCSNCSSRLHKMAARAKNRENLKQHFLHYLADFNKTWIVLWEVLYQTYSNHFAPLHKMEARAKRRKNSNHISLTS